MTEQFEFVDRYSATGRPYPKAETVCLGQCEGMGCVPIEDPERKGVFSGRKEERPVFVQLWNQEHTEHCSVAGVIRGLWRHKEFWYWRSIFRDVWRLVTGKGYCDGWHFVKCPDCEGTGLRPAQTTD